MEYRIRNYPDFSACGLNCGLCPRYYTDGSSRCPGCAGAGFSEVHPPCGILSCCERRGLEYCFLCEDYPCGKYDGVDLSDSFITHQNQIRDLEKAKRIGMDAYKSELDEKISILNILLENYNDGRSKGFFCIAVNLLELGDVNSILEKIQGEAGPGVSRKEMCVLAVRLFREIADQRGISLKLRK